MRPMPARKVSGRTSVESLQHQALIQIFGTPESVLSIFAFHVDGREHLDA